MVELRYFYFFVTSILHRKISKKGIDSLIDAFDVKEAEKVKKIEKETNHDVKAVEYYVKDMLLKKHMPYTEYVHIGLTSDDVNSIANGFLLRDVREKVTVPILSELIGSMSAFALKYKGVPMLARTHGQPAVPTTFGKELMNFAYRITSEVKELQTLPIEAKLTGAVGNFNAHVAAFPNIDWTKKSREFVSSLGLTPNIMTTQILPADKEVALFQCMERINSICIGLTQDMWRYISDGYIKQKVTTGEVGSSTMPQKVNPIDFENAEGNLQTANALLRFFSEKLPISRLQRDLSDSTVKRSFGSAFAYSVLGYQSCIRGLAKIAPDTNHMEKELLSHWEIVTEGIQTILRISGDRGAYEKVKMFARGKMITKESLDAFISSLSVSANYKKRLYALSPLTYIGVAEKLVEEAYQNIHKEGFV
jgi:adenylosuccinate lyase